MSWLQTSIELGTLDPGPVELALLELGAVCIEYSNAGDEAILEPAVGATPLWNELVISALLPENTDPDCVRIAVAMATSASCMPRTQFRSLADANWIASWRQSLKPQQFGSDLWICPVDQEPPRQAKAIVSLDPGLAFGTGGHPTTALCLDWLAQQASGKEILDFGCGSGILAIAAISLGSHRATAVDNDPQALLATRQNAGVNDCRDQIEILPADELPREQQFDLVVANILSGSLISLAPRLVKHCKVGASIGLSGILPKQVASVMDAYAAWIWFAEPRERDAWVLLTGKFRA